MQRIAILVFLVLTVSLMGCASILNPYSSDFQCPETDKGKCVSVQTAHSESVGKNDSNNKVKTLKDELKESDRQKNQKSDSAYQEALYKKLAGLLIEPNTPIVAPPQIMRVLFLSYGGDDNELFMPRYIYFFVDEPKWVLGEDK